MNKFFHFNELYQDKAGRHIYLETKTNTPRLVPNSEFKKVNAFHQRVPVAISVGALFGVITKNYPLGIFMGVLAFVVFEYILRKRIIPSLNILKKYDIQQNRVPAKELTDTMLWIKLFVYLIAGALLVYLGITDSKDQLSQILVVAFGLFSIYLGIRSIFEVIDRKK